MSASGGNKSKNDLALRLYEEALSIYKSVHPCTHYTVCLTSHALVGVLGGLKKFDKGSVLLKECIAITKIAREKDRVMENYLSRQVHKEQRNAKYATALSSTTNTTSGTSGLAANFRNLSINTNTYNTSTTNTNATTTTNLLKAQLALESNELALQASTSYLGTTLTVLARLHDLSKAHHIAIGLYKEAIVCMRELRLVMVRRYREKQQLSKGQRDGGEGE